MKFNEIASLGVEREFIKSESAGSCKILTHQSSMFYSTEEKFVKKKPLKCSIYTITNYAISDFRK
jgi:hypothetical protein